MYETFDLIVELDGRMFHSKFQRHDSDLDRDLDAAVGKRLTVRLGWGQAYDRACGTAFKLGRVFQERGWDGAPHRCTHCPPGFA